MLLWNKPGGTVVYPAHPRLICHSVLQSVHQISFNYSAENRLGPINLMKLRIVQFLRVLMLKVGGIWSYIIFRWILFEGADSESWRDLEPYNFLPDSF